MANQGKRMVKENLIVQISQKQDELTAGTGIDITNDTISVDTDTVASGVPTFSWVLDQA